MKTALNGKLSIMESITDGIERRIIITDGIEQNFRKSVCWKLKIQFPIYSEVIQGIQWGDIRKSCAENRKSDSKFGKKPEEKHSEENRITS